jgi:hypothetical protein
MASCSFRVQKAATMDFSREQSPHVKESWEKGVMRTGLETTEPFLRNLIDKASEAICDDHANVMSISISETTVNGYETRVTISQRTNVNERHSTEAKCSKLGRNRCAVNKYKLDSISVRGCITFSVSLIQLKLQRKSERLPGGRIRPEERRHVYK